MKTIQDVLVSDPTRAGKASGCIVSLEATYHLVSSQTVADKFRAQFLRKGILKDYSVVFKFKVVSDTGKQHTVFIKINPDYDLTDWVGNTVQIYCDCQDFKFRCAYLLDQDGALFLNDKIKLSLGAALTDAPKYSSSLGLCKHAYAALSWLVSNYSGLMRFI